MKKKLNKTIFLDRDGVINVDSSYYIKSWDEFSFIPGSLEALRMLHEKAFDVILITNQSIINRGMILQKVLDHIFLMMQSEIESTGGKITDIFFCPHTPEEGCACRKPLPGLIRKAQEKYEIDIPESIMVGDSAKDIQCARNAGCGTAILVKTGNEAEARETLLQENVFPDHVADNLLSAVKWILKKKHLL
ncbi:MAG: D-glycero-beta-D-manno-heptose 1,7-bisphosphate 7-phosphatase [Desulfobacterales bacterium]